MQTFGQFDFPTTDVVADSKTEIPQLREELANLERVAKFVSFFVSVFTFRKRCTVIVISVNLKLAYDFFLKN